MPLINCGINLLLVISSATGAAKIAITDTKFYVLDVNLSTEDNTKLLQELKSGFKITINWKKFQSNVTM